jgi:D-alanyl-D-alanine carboxypeptidase/D-alanyl-D-alanine-endopeptidase (penicillin-binding protein 4)
MREIIFLLTLILTSLLVIGNENLPKQISKISLTPGNYSLIVKKINSDEVWQKNSDQSFNFASVNKILTSIIAFDLLGPEFQFKTKFFTNGEIKEGVLEGDLIIKGEVIRFFSYNDLEAGFKISSIKRHYKY